MVSWEEVQDLRDRAEREQREATGRRFADQEARYPDFMTQLLRQLFPGQDVTALLAEVTGYELDMEAAMLVPRAGLVEWLRRMHAAGRKFWCSPTSICRQSTCGG